MPKNLIVITKFLYSDMICLITYLTAGAIGTFFQDTFLQFVGTLTTLSASSILVFYLKKWLEKKDSKINKNGGFFSFISKVFKNKVDDIRGN